MLRLLVFLSVCLLLICPVFGGSCCYHDGCTGCNDPGTWCTLAQSNCEGSCGGKWCGGGSDPTSGPSPPSGACPSRPTCLAGADLPKFPEPSVTVDVKNLTDEQKLWQQEFPGYLNGVSMGGMFVIEDWMFWRNSGPFDDSTLHLRNSEGFSQNAWSEALLRSKSQKDAFDTINCHVNHYLEDADLDKLAEWGVNAVRMPVGYWYFEDVDLYPNDKWRVEPTNATNGYGVNPEGFITPGTLPLTNMIIRLHNRNIKVLLDVHAQSGCSSPRQSYAGIICQASGPNTWNGKAEDGISGGHTTTRARDGKTWLEVARKILVQRIVPYVDFINQLAPGAVLGIEPVNEPDIMCNDASTDQVRCLTLDVGEAMLDCLKNSVASHDVEVVMSNAANNYQTSTIASDYRSGTYSGLKNSLMTDIHHYYNWGGCGNPLSLSCVCHTGVSGFDNQDNDWKNYQNAGVIDDGWKVFVGEWSSALGVAHSCNGGGPDANQAHQLYVAQKYSYLRNYAQYDGKTDSKVYPSSFIGDFYWTARMGYNWNPDPSVCYGPTSITDFKDYSSWDWSFIRLIELNLVPKLSSLGWTRANLASHEGDACSGSIRVNC
eukprot:TRINITY_DN640_c0_g2_i1.p1 TRINITY_DN640_c0_g2~~TRINITY_DN640_c0_g2_i1.p1  ORF type:complete len:600 (+),score=134.55 TRINITY_DN640_c0_g2_i1:75-1874(+)